MIRAALLAVVALGGTVAAAAADETWTAPQAERIRSNPVEPSPAVLERGHALYRKHCASCHGETGKGDGPAERYSDEPAADLTLRAVQERLTDGEIFWKLSTGRQAGGDVIMPGLARKVPSVEERWKLVRFVRTLAAATAP